MYSVQFNNALPESGGILEQNALVMNALMVVREEVHKVEEWRRWEEAQRKDREDKVKQRANRRR